LNIYQTQARHFKANLLADFLTRYGITAELAELLDGDGWRKVANCARIPRSPSPEIQAGFDGPDLVFGDGLMRAG